VDADAEGAILARLDAGDPSGAADLLIREYGPRVIGYLRGMLRDETDVGDAFALWAEQSWRGIAGFERRSTVLTWAFRAAWSAAMKVKDEAWRRYRVRLETRDAEALAQEVLTRTAVRVERQRAELEALRAELSLSDQSLLALRLDQGLSWAEVAQVMAEEGEPADEPTLRKRYERIKRRLGELVEERRRAGGDR
jgi:RNA polymerase sigma-70 factor (ECF subfamily)